MKKRRKNTRPNKIPKKVLRTTFYLRFRYKSTTRLNSVFKSFQGKFCTVIWQAFAVPGLKNPLMIFGMTLFFSLGEALDLRSTRINSLSFNRK